jgi:serine/threonine protein kinase
MRLETGAQIGAYRIVRPIGAGGMGEVYVAEDTRLGREVALKILPRDVAADPHRRQRLEREAQAAARLNHPNIVTLHSLEEHDGVAFFTMEYVDGQPLAKIVPPDGMPLEKLLSVAVPLTDAVAAAHHSGIIHRDLKPGNIVVTANGRVKVLDFGLAKLHDVVHVDAGASTNTMPLTGDGHIVGTVAYMSPEQAEGRPIDARSDIFSLGVVLYEMATGRRPFQGNSSVSVISSILRDNPPPVTETNPHLPSDLARIIRRALQKDPERRYQTALDLRNDLQELKDDSDSGQIPRPVTTEPKSRKRLVPVVATIAGLAVAAFTLFWFWPRHKIERPTVTEVLERAITTNSTEFPVWFTAISVDGQYLAYTDARGIHLRVIDTGETRSIPAPENLCFT